jgi:two-component system, chemotaxis family, chemotaxis protein CheY
MSKIQKEILIIEDNEATRLLLNSILTKANYKVNIKSDCIQALSWMKVGNIPSMIVLDIHMPLMNGKDFLAAMKNSGLFKNIPILIVSSIEVEDDNELLELGAAGIIRKPYNPNVLRDKVKAILNPNLILQKI